VGKKGEGEKERRDIYTDSPPALSLERELLRDAR